MHKGLIIYLCVQHQIGRTGITSYIVIYLIELMQSFKEIYLVIITINNIAKEG